VDDAAVAGRSNFYRLTETDNDGKVTVFDIRSLYVRATALQTYFAGNMLMVNIGHGNYSRLTYRIVNMCGAVIRTDEVRSSLQPVNVSSLTSGQYVIALSNGNVARFQKK
jgi:hypothetical protein